MTGPGIATVRIVGQDQSASAFASADARFEQFLQKARSGAAGPLTQYALQIKEIEQRHREADQALALGRTTREAYETQLRTIIADTKELSMRTSLGGDDAQRLANIAQRAQGTLTGMGRAERTAVDGAEALAAGVQAATQVMQGNLGAANAMTGTLQRFARGSPTMVNAIGGIGALVSVISLGAMALRSWGEEAEKANQKTQNLVHDQAMRMRIPRNVTPEQRLATGREQITRAEETRAGLRDVPVPAAIRERGILLNSDEIATAVAINRENERQRGILASTIGQMRTVVGQSEDNLRFNQQQTRELQAQRDALKEIRQLGSFRDFLEQNAPDVLHGAQGVGSARQAAAEAGFERFRTAGMNGIDATQRGVFAVGQQYEALRPAIDALPNISDQLGMEDVVRESAMAADEVQRMLGGLSLLERMGVHPIDLLSTATHAMTDGLAAGLDAITRGGKVLNAALKQVLRDIGVEARTKMIFELGEAAASFFNLAKGGPPATAMHLKAAGFYAAASLAAGAGANAIGGGGGGPTGGGAGVAAAGAGASSLAGSASRGTVIIQIPKDLVDLPRGRAAVLWVRDMVEEINQGEYVVRTR